MLTGFSTAWADWTTTTTTTTTTPYSYDPTWSEWTTTTTKKTTTTPWAAVSCSEDPADWGSSTVWPEWTTTTTTTPYDPTWAEWTTAAAVTTTTTWDPAWAEWTTTTKATTTPSYVAPAYVWTTTTTKAVVAAYSTTAYQAWGYVVTPSLNSLANLVQHQHCCCSLANIHRCRRCQRWLVCRRWSCCCRRHCYGIDFSFGWFHDSWCRVKLEVSGDVTVAWTIIRGGGLGQFHMHTLYAARGRMLVT